jgi:hypothetical protein
LNYISALKKKKEEKKKSENKIDKSRKDEKEDISALI